jgi:hypothetical protein
MTTGSREKELTGRTRPILKVDAKDADFRARPFSRPGEGTGMRAPGKIVSFCPRLRPLGPAARPDRIKASAWRVERGFGAISVDWQPFLLRLRRLMLSGRTLRRGPPFPDDGARLHPQMEAGRVD